MIRLKRLPLLAILVAAPLNAQAVSTSESRALAAQSGGGVLGSAAGMAVSLLITRPDRCETDDDVVCPLKAVGLASVMGAVGAVIGVELGARASKTESSALGASLGTVVGTAAAAGLIVLSKETVGEMNTPTVFAVVAISQGTLGALGSRLLKR